MYAIIKTGGKQYHVQKDDIIKVEKINSKVGDVVCFDEVLAVSGDETIIGNPIIADYCVNAKVVEQGKDDKIIIFKFKAKKDYRRKNGHRQPYTLVKIIDIVKSAKDSQKQEAKADVKTNIKADISMKKAELLEIAESMGLKIPTRATKADIIEAIESK